jgi:vancomycin permeability regulator SanA
MKRVLIITLLALVALLAYPAWLGYQVYEQSNDDQVHTADAIVVLGAAQYDGEPSPIFRARLDHALFLYGEDLAETIVVTGGKRPGDRFTEAETGEIYLAARAVPDASILTEPEGSSTLESLRGVREIARDRSIETLLLVSDPLHSERIKRIAHDLGFDEAYTSWASYTRLERSRMTKAREFVREIGALLVYELFSR